MYTRCIVWLQIASIAIVMTTCKPFIARAVAADAAIPETPAATETVTATPTATVLTPTPTYCIAEWAWLSRELPQAAAAGVPFTVHYAWRGGTAVIERVEERVPAGWQVLSPPFSRHAGDTYVWNVYLPYWNDWHIEVLPPADVPSGDYSLYGSTTSWHSCNGEQYMSIEGDWKIHVSPLCVGDCGIDGRVTIDDLVKAVSIALGESDLGTCPTSDRDQDGTVTVDEIVQAVRMALGSCPS